MGSKERRDTYLKNYVCCPWPPVYLFLPRRILGFLPERPYSINGIKMILRKNSDDIFFIMPYLEKDVQSRLMIYKNETFVDVGANIGVHSLKVAHDYKDKSVNIIAIEAHPETYHALLKNIECNNFKNIRGINKAVSDHKGTVTLYENREYDKITGSSHLHHHLSSILNTFNENSALQVECDTLDNILANNKVDVMKIDIEGAEVLALKGATNTLKKLRKIIVEIHGNNFEQVKHILENHGLELEIIGGTKSFDDKRISIGYIIGSK